MESKSLFKFHAVVCEYNRKESIVSVKLVPVFL